MSAEPVRPKGILKAPREPAGGTARDVALQHANILQHRKDLEAEILDSLILLSEYPTNTSPSISAARPDPGDVAGFKQNIRLFQPSDYDDLITERHVNKLCGYTLCPKPPRNCGPGGKWKITASGIVEREEIEKWCSWDCARRALYVKIQLNETAAWERAGIPDIHIDLLDEIKSDKMRPDEVAQRLQDLKLEDPDLSDRVAQELRDLNIQEQEQERAAQDQAALALERGDNASLPNPVVDRIMIEERDGPESSPSTDVFDDDDDKIEGYKSKLRS